MLIVLICIINKVLKTFRYLLITIFLCLINFCLFPKTLQAASGSYGWAYAWTRTAGGTAEEFGGTGITMDNSGNIFITGGFGGTIEFNGTGIGDADEHSANGDYNDIFITKYNSDGSYAWTKTFGGTHEDYGQGIASDSSGNVFITGYFQGTVNFDGTGGTDNHTSQGGTDIFITKYNADGTYGWTKTIGSTGDQLGYKIAVDDSDDVIAMGHFSATVDFDPSEVIENHTSTEGNVFITKYSNEGSYRWTRTFGNSSYLVGYTMNGFYGLTTDADDYIYATGYFTGTADFDGSGSTDIHTSNGGDDIFITRLSTDGTYKWTHTLGGNSADRGLGIATDTNGRVFVTGYFSGTVNFDTNGGTDNRSSNGSTDIFILCLKENGKSEWVKSIGGTGSDYGTDITTDNIGNIFISGGYIDTVNFDATGGTDNHTAGPGGEYFVTKYNADVSYGWTRGSSGTTVDDYADSLGVAANNRNVYVTGFYIGTVDFDDSVGEDIHTSDSSTFDFFLTSYTDDTPVISEIFADASNAEADVEWTTDINSSSQVEYGLIKYFGNFTDESDTSVRVKTHTKNVPDLKVCARYHYRVLSTDGDDNKGISTKRYFNTSGCLASSIVSGVSDYIAVAGGTLSTENGQTTVTLLAPNDYFSEGSVIQINILDPSAIPPTDSGKSLVKGNFYNLLAVSDSDDVISSFDEPIVFTINYGADTQATFYENTLDVYKYDGARWDKQNCTLDTVNNTITCYLGSFSVYAVLGSAKQTVQNTTYLSAASAPTCNDIQNQSIPDLFQIDVDSTRATVYYAPVAGRNTDYYISFSERAGIYEHGTFTGQGESSGVLSFTVYYLKPNTTYYFMIRGQNGCMPGEWSGEMRIKTRSKGFEIKIPFLKIK